MRREQPHIKFFKDPAPISRIRDWPTFFEQIRLRPGMWLGVVSLSALNNLLSGIMLAEDLHAIPAERRLGGFDWRAFAAWVEREFNPQRLSVNSFSLALMRSSSEAEAFALWFDWYDRFRSTGQDTSQE
jgi:hypothetical protein